jgi:hypothetical protein
VTDRRGVIRRLLLSKGLVGSLVGAVGALFAGFPELLASKINVSMKAALQGMFVLYALIGIGAALIYLGLPKNPANEAPRVKAPLEKSKAMVYKLAALFSLDSFSGGLILDSMIARGSTRSFSSR